MKTAFEFDFDEWADLAKSDPDQFMLKRDSLMAETRARMNASSRPVIEWVCWRIEIERKRSTTPMQLCMTLSSLMWSRHTDLTNALYSLSKSNQKYLELFRMARDQNREAKRTPLRLVYKR